MLSTGTITVPSACLQYQLRQVVCRTGKRVSATRLETSKCGRPRGFVGSTRQCQDSGQRTFDDNSNGNSKPHLSEYPLGRIHGKRGRRQRETSARLKQESMEKPFDVVVLRDVPDQQDDSRAMPKSPAYVDSVGSATDAAQIAREVLENPAPSEEEIFESIEASRPDTRMLEENDYKRLVKSLLDGYSMRQLSGYLAKLLHGASSSTDVEPNGSRPKEPRKSSWRPGTTPLGQRHDDFPTLKKNDIGTKNKVVDRIVRNGWGLTTEVEIRQLGELDMTLEDWELSFLFDLQDGDRPMYENFISSPLLRRCAQVQPYRRDNVIRITARKHDAEDVAGQIQKHLKRLFRLEFKTSSFQSLHRRSGRSSLSDGLFPDRFLGSISQRLVCVIERRDQHTFTLHGRSSETLETARRLMLSFLDLPAKHSVEYAQILTASGTEFVPSHGETTFLLPDQSVKDIRTEYGSEKFGRSTLSGSLAKDSAVAETIDSAQVNEQMSWSSIQAERVTARVLAMESGIVADLDNARASKPMWYMADVDQPWEVHFCRVLQPATDELSATGRISGGPRRKRASNANASKYSIVQSNIPGIHKLLTYFTPLHEHADESFIKAHFVASPFTKHGIKPLHLLPRVQIEFRMTRDASRGRSRVIRRNDMMAKMSEQELRVHLPQEIVDLRMLRSNFATPLQTDESNESQIKAFQEQLQQDVDRTNSSLAGKPSITLQLPVTSDAASQDWYKKGIKKTEAGLQAQYFLEGLESRQRLDLMPISSNLIADPTMKKIFGEMTDDMTLRYEVIDGGFVGGRRVELSLQYRSKQDSTWSLQSHPVDAGSRDRQNGETGVERSKDREKRLSKLTETGLRLANALTRISAGQLNSHDQSTADQW